MSSPSLSIDCTSVCKAYRRGNSVAAVLNGVNLQVGRGECIVLAGPSGSGKTTLLAILGCTLRADEGSVRILGGDVSEFSAGRLAAFRRDKIGFLFQQFHLIRGLSAVENVAVPLLLTGMPERTAKKFAAERMAAVGLADFLKSDPRQMSVGQCQRVALARAVINRPDLILADEPTASLDAASGQAALQLIRNIVDQEGRTAVIVTHDTSVFKYADRVFELREGRLAEKVPIAEEGGAWGAGETGRSTESTERRPASTVRSSPWSLLGHDIAARYGRLTTDN